MGNRWYKPFRYVPVDPWPWIYNRPYHIDGEKIPQEGPALMVSSHLTVIDHFFFPLVHRRQLTFLARVRYFVTPGFVGGIQKLLFSSVGQVPIDRISGDAACDVLIVGLKVLPRGDLLGISLEGTRSPDGRPYRDKIGAVRVALRAGVPVFPMAVIDTEKASLIGLWTPRPVKVGTIIDDPIDPSEYKVKYSDEYEAARALTDDPTREIQKLSGQEYVDTYTTDMKRSLEAGNGYPTGTEPGGELATPTPGPKPTPRR